MGNCTQGTFSSWALVKPNTLSGGWLIAYFTGAGCTGTPVVAYSTPLNGCGPDSLGATSIEVSTARIAVAPLTNGPYGWSQSLTAGYAVGIALASFAFLYLTVLSIVGCCILVPNCFCHRQCKGRSIFCCCLLGEGGKGEKVLPPTSGYVTGGSGSGSSSSDEGFGGDTRLVALRVFPASSSALNVPPPRPPRSPEDTALKVLFKACRRGDTESIFTILSATPELVFLTDKNRRTPLHLAAQVGSLPAISALLTFNPDLQAENEHGDTAEDMAKRFGPFPEVIAMLREHAHST